MYRDFRERVNIWLVIKLFMGGKALLTLKMSRV